MIADRLAAVRDRVVDACARAGRDPGEVGLIAVGKTFPIDAIREAYAAGQRDFGENYAQELRDKAKEASPEVRWHFIGRLQANKAKYVAPVAYRVHAIEQVADAEALVARAGGRPVVGLVAINLGDESSKGGVSPSSALEVCEALAQVSGFELRGLMCLPPWQDDPQRSAPYFDALRALAARGRERGLPLHELSMGMSHDFEVAIAHGATWIRVGSAIFGERG